MRRRKVQGRKKTKYMSKGGVVKRMGGSKVGKNTKYRSKGGVVRRRSGGKAGRK
jgi:hypothetical protein